MTAYTVWSDYGATGEGRTLCMWMGYCANEAEAQDQFLAHFDVWYLAGAHVEPGFSFDNPCAQLLITDHMKHILQDSLCYKSYHAHMHFNYS